jgi:hypothetical protein
MGSTDRDESIGQRAGDDPAIVVDHDRAQLCDNRRGEAVILLEASRTDVWARSSAAMSGDETYNGA